MRPTRVVDLAAMSRDELMSVAVRQADSIREKSIRLRETEELLESIMAEVGRVHPHAEANPTLRSSTPTGQPIAATAPPPPMIDDLFGTPGTTTQDEAHTPSPHKGPPRPWSPPPTMRSCSAAATNTSFGLQEMLDEERAQYAAIIQSLEHQLSEAQQQLQQLQPAPIPANVLDEAVQAKLATWKERVTQSMQKDRDRIEELEAQLAAQQQHEHPPHIPTTQEATPPHAPPTHIPDEVLNAAVQEKLAVWRQRVTESMQKDRDRIEELETQLAHASKTHQQLEAELIASRSAAHPEHTATEGNELRAELESLRVAAAAATDSAAEASELRAELESLRVAAAAATDSAAEASELRAELESLRVAAAAATDSAAEASELRAELESLRVAAAAATDSAAEASELRAELESLRVAAAGATDSAAEASELRAELESLRVAAAAATDSAAEASELRAELESLRVAAAAASGSACPVVCGERVSVVAESRWKVESLSPLCAESVDVLQERCAYLSMCVEELVAFKRAVMAEVMGSEERGG